MTNTGLRVVVDAKSVVPISEQIRSEIAYLIRSSALEMGTRLPTVRDLAADLGVAVNTVNKAYAELEREGLTESRRRAGTIVTYQAQRPAQHPKTARAIKQLIKSADEENVDATTLMALLKTAAEDASNASTASTR